MCSENLDQADDLEGRNFAMPDESYKPNKVNKLTHGMDSHVDEMKCAFDKATDCLCPLSVRRWDGNLDVDEKTFQLFEFRIT
jgi:hypothetical protein